MISLIICSRTPRISKVLFDNIKQTIGVIYELIVIDNSIQKYTIFSAYNEGVRLSAYPILCFMHDDIAYHTQNWGQAATKHFEDLQVGMIGIAGSPYYSKLPGAWWSSGLINEYILPWKEQAIVPNIKTTNAQSIKNQVVALDGVWFCIRKSLFHSINFDEVNYKGFHFYDIDISMQINNLGYKLYSVFDILIQHFSHGNMNRNWIESAMVFKRKWNNKLPVKCIYLDYNTQCNIEFKSLNEFIEISLQNAENSKKIHRWALLQLLRYWESYLFYKTPVYFLRYLRKCF